MISIFGKTQAHGDFVKVNAGAPIVGILSQWLVDGVQLLRQSRMALPDAPVGFMFANSTQRDILVGAFVNSQDKVGRQFPLAIFTSVDPSVATTNFQLIPRIYDGFLNDAVNILMSAARLDVNELAARANALRVPGQTELTQAQFQTTNEFNMLSMAEFQAQFNGIEQPSHNYAFHALLRACQPLYRQSPPTTGGVTLECPLLSSTMCAAWLDMTRSLLQWSTPPSFFWTSSPPQRLLLSLGNPTPSVLKYIAGADSNAAKLWPLQTTSTAAIASASQALPPALLSALNNPSGNMNQLLAVIATQASR